MGESETPIPLHFALGPRDHVDCSTINALEIPLRDLFDAPDLAHTETRSPTAPNVPPRGGPYPLSAFTAPRVDYSLFRLAHYTGTDADHFQNFVIFKTTSSTSTSSAASQGGYLKGGMRFTSASSSLAMS